MSKFKLELVGICGIYCGVCPVFKVNCPGCLNDPRSKDCVLYSCAVKRPVRFCFECAEFPCQIHYEKGIYTKQALDNWKRMMKKKQQP